ncbi:FAD-dependent monooxygenase [Hymenobacter sp. BT175]|uniref:FAD-dependent monooxygenase n=1 Tax=Hymenobacter translucens TaxID=2886507 RepID=UPI001D0EFD47|nr:FAD-dependent monooxygenase [Hymenobacter translucens]MCC2545617.1 FAD-dependent monooxygenase [Hymenobacter translucens]
MKTIAITGAGIGGLCAAIALRQQGFTVLVYEAAPAVRAVGAGIVLAANALKALAALGLQDQVVARGLQLSEFGILTADGQELRRIDSRSVSKRYGVPVGVTIARPVLHELLLSQLPAGIVQTGKALTCFTQDKQGVRLHFADGSSSQADALIAADGLHSAVRRQLLPDVPLRYAGYTCWRALASSVPVGFDFARATETWGPAGRVGLVPLAGGQVYWYACLNAGPRNAELSALTPKQLAGRFGHYHQPVAELLAATPVAQVLHHDILDFAPIRRFAYDWVALLGDAAHATTPNLGQGACQAIEDAVVLAHSMARYPEMEAGLRAYEQRRVARTTAVVNQSWRLGQVAQLENPLLVRLRNAVLRRLPARMGEQQQAFLYNVDFQG